MRKGIENDHLKLLGASLRKAREARGLSLRELSALCTIDHSDIGKMEKGMTNITVLTLIELSKALQLHPQKIFDFAIDFDD